MSSSAASYPTITLFYKGSELTFPSMHQLNLDGTDVTLPSACGETSIGSLPRDSFHETAQALNQEIADKYLRVWQNQHLLEGFNKKQTITSSSEDWVNNCSLIILNVAGEQGCLVEETQAKAQALSWVIYDFLQERQLEPITLQQLRSIVATVAKADKN